MFPRYFRDSDRPKSGVKGFPGKAMDGKCFPVTAIGLPGKHSAIPEVRLPKTFPRRRYAALLGNVSPVRWLLNVPENVSPSSSFGHSGKMFPRHADRVKFRNVSPVSRLQECSPVKPTA